MSAVAVQPAPGEIIESVIAKGDLSKLTPEERTRFYMETCRSIGLNPMTRPLEYLVLSGKTVLYARRDAADQLRKLHQISVEILDRSVADDLFTVHVRARDATGRTDEDLGVVTIGSLKGEARANAILKAITKAKRRVTLSISGLGFLDETEVEDIPASERRPLHNTPRPVTAVPQLAPPTPPVNPETGEVSPHQIIMADSADRGLRFGRDFIGAMQSVKSELEFDGWMTLNHDAIETVRLNAPKAFKSVLNAIEEARARITPPMTGDAQDDDLGDARGILLGA